jgi:hypothetical protein
MAETNDKRKKLAIHGLNLFQSRVEGDVPLSRLSEIYFVLRAIEGDKLAQDILDAAGSIICDVDGNQIYPPVPKDK